ncbi:MAG: fatty acid desaturase, partial [Gemmatimonas sp.]
MALPVKHNVVLVVSLQLACWTLLWGMERTGGWSAVALAAVLSCVLLTNYALMHEGSHDLLVGTERANRMLARVACALFPTSFTLFRVAHDAHHCSNKSLLESFDYYRPGDNRLLKILGWYAILLGPNWLLMPVGSVLLSIDPRLLQRGVFARMAATQRLATLYAEPGVRITILGETLFVIAYWALVIQLLGLSVGTLLLAAAVFAFHWSTRQYLTHAYTPCDVIDGAHNLSANRAIATMLLNGHLDLVHHQKPWLPWSELPEHLAESRPPVDTWALYRSMWFGPR